LKRIILISFCTAAIFYGLFRLSLLFPAKVENRNLTLGIEGQVGSFSKDPKVTMFFGLEKSTDSAPVTNFLGGNKSNISVTLRDGKTEGRMVACVPSHNLIGSTQVEFDNPSQPVETMIQLTKSSPATLQFDELATTPSFYQIMTFCK